jgi:hypothetical protein
MIKADELYSKSALLIYGFVTGQGNGYFGQYEGKIPCNCWYLRPSSGQSNDSDQIK